MMLGGAAAAIATTIPAPVRSQPTRMEDVRVLRAAALEGRSPPALAYGGTVPGPILRLRRGDELAVRLINSLDEATALDWHGLRGAGMLASPPQRPPLAPGTSVDMRLACPDAGTFWYHAERHDQARRGLHGLLVVEESEPVAVDRDLPLIIADAPVSDAGAPALMANGAPTLQWPVRTNERLRLRLVNAASRVLAVRIEAHRPMVMALDGQPCEPFVARDAEVFLGPGNRADLFVDMVLTPGAAAAIVAQTESGTATVATLSYGETPLRAAPLAPPQPLPANDLPARMDFAGAFKSDLVLTGTLTGAEPSSRPAFSIRRGRTVMLGLSNRTAAVQVVRVHGHAFRLLDRLDDGWKPFWLDTLVVPSGGTHRVAFVPDRAGAFLITAAGIAGAPSLTTWFEVT
ncbi:multicopper oxidase family protein [Xanthobacteraceae bacterium Astr-EGSB]|uniref:multicopper oxidase family protein n=1 Tax=Astrobacterium formosum TaxID=3069710 RepID=UPI0027B5411B|nr:multicopper oxidase family protein [Xanthobacteraceae bacterium Astr-EGSB]